MPGALPALDFHAYHRGDLPRLLAAGRGALAGPAAQRLGSLAFRLPDGAAYTYVPHADGVDVVPGDDGADTLIELDRDAWQGLVHELESAPGLLYAGRVKCLRGRAMKLVVWEPGLRAMYNGRPVFDPNEVRLADRHGAALDVTRSFHGDDEREDMAQFLRSAGYLLVRDVFAPEEIATFRSCADRLRQEAEPGDRESWWGRNASGEDVLCRVTRAAAEPALRALLRDDRVARLVSLADEPLVARGELSREGVTVIYKNPDMLEGLADLPWHRDCGMGGHAVMCPILILSIFLQPVTPETGELRMLPGSWLGSCPPIDVQDPRAPRGVSLVADPGDVSLHYGDVMHAAPAPSRSDLDAYRTSVVMAFARPGSAHHRGERGYNDVLLSREDGQVEHLAKVAKRS